MKNIEKYEDELENLEEIYPICYIAVHKLGLSRNDGECDDTCCQKCEKEAFKWLLEEYKEPILTEKEKAYLKNVIEPRKKDIVDITKWKYCTEKENEYFVVMIIMKNPHTNYCIHLLDFITTEDMPFENLELYKHYTLEELGL